MGRQKRNTLAKLSKTSASKECPTNGIANGILLTEWTSWEASSTWNPTHWCFSCAIPLYANSPRNNNGTLKKNINLIEGFNDFYIRLEIYSWKFSGNFIISECLQCHMFQNKTPAHIWKGREKYFIKFQERIISRTWSMKCMNFTHPLQHYCLQHNTFIPISFCKGCWLRFSVFIIFYIYFPHDCLQIFFPESSQSITLVTFFFFKNKKCNFLGKVCY